MSRRGPRRRASRALFELDAGDLGRHCIDRTRVITAGVTPTLHVAFKHSDLKW